MLSRFGKRASRGRGSPAERAVRATGAARLADAERARRGDGAPVPGRVRPRTDAAGPPRRADRSRRPARGGAAASRKAGDELRPQEFSEPVVCRNGHDVVIRRVPDQWFIRYGDPGGRRRPARRVARRAVVVPAGVRPGAPGDPRLVRGPPVHPARAVARHALPARPVLGDRADRRLHVLPGLLRRPPVRRHRADPARPGSPTRSSTTSSSARALANPRSTLGLQQEVRAAFAVLVPARPQHRREGAQAGPLPGVSLHPRAAAPRRTCGRGACSSTGGSSTGRGEDVEEGHRLEGRARFRRSARRSPGGGPTRSASSTPRRRAPSRTSSGTRPSSTPPRTASTTRAPRPGDSAGGRAAARPSSTGGFSARSTASCARSAPRSRAADLRRSGRDGLRAAFRHASAATSRGAGDRGPRSRSVGSGWIAMLARSPLTSPRSSGGPLFRVSCAARRSRDRGVRRSTTRPTRPRRSSTGSRRTSGRASAWRPSAGTARGRGLLRRRPVEAHRGRLDARGARSEPEERCPSRAVLGARPRPTRSSRRTAAMCAKYVARVAPPCGPNRRRARRSTRSGASGRRRPTSPSASDSRFGHRARPSSEGAEHDPAGRRDRARPGRPAFFLYGASGPAAGRDAAEGKLRCMRDGDRVRADRPVLGARLRVVACGDRPGDLEVDQLPDRHPGVDPDRELHGHLERPVVAEPLVALARPSSGCRCRAGRRSTFPRGTARTRGSRCTPR